MLQTIIIEKLKTRILYSLNFPPKIVGDNVEEFGTARRATGDKKHAQKKMRLTCRLEARIWTGHTHNFNTYWNIQHDTAPLS